MKAPVAAALLLAACGTAATAPDEQPAAAGQRAFAKCDACHSLEPGRALSGPTVHRIVGRPVAAEAGFDYSPALERFAGVNPVWTRPLLDRFVADPEALVPGTSMSFHGISDPAERKALLDYLESAGR